MVHAEAFGEAQEHDLLEPMVNATRGHFEALGEADVFSSVKLTADAGFHSEANMKMLAKAKIDAYVADNQFRKRDPRFAEADRFRERSRKERARREGRRTSLFATQDFIFAADLSHCTCPAGKKLYRNGNVEIKNHHAVKFRGSKSACVGCSLRTQCLRHPERTETRQVAFFTGRSEEGKNTFTERMKRKIDSAVGRMLYAMRLGTVEPVFGNICAAMGLDRFTLRTKRKVNTQWNLFCIVHNLKKIHQYGPGFA